MSNSLQKCSQGVFINNSCEDRMSLIMNVGGEFGKESVRFLFL